MNNLELVNEDSLEMEVWRGSDRPERLEVRSLFLLCQKRNKKQPVSCVNTLSIKALVCLKSAYLVWDFIQLQWVSPPIRPNV